MNKKQIQNLITQARKENNRSDLDAYQAVLSAIQKEEASNNKDLADSEILEIIQKEANAFKESYGWFLTKNLVTAQRLDKQYNCLLKLLPKNVPEKNYGKVVDHVINNFDGTPTIKDMGKIMKSIKDEHGTTVDMKKISGIVKQKLSQ